MGPEQIRGGLGLNRRGCCWPELYQDIYFSCIYMHFLYVNILGIHAYIRDRRECCWPKLCWDIYLLRICAFCVCKYIVQPAREAFIFLAKNAEKNAFLSCLIILNFINDLVKAACQSLLLFPPPPLLFLTTKPDITLCCFEPRTHHLAVARETGYTKPNRF